jgi:hypothetical protein
VVGRVDVLAVPAALEAQLEDQVAVARSDAFVEAPMPAAPKKVCVCEAPGMFGSTIGSSGDWLDTAQSVWNSGTSVVPAGTLTGLTGLPLERPAPGETIEV